MARTKSFFDDVKKEIECPVCQEQFGANKQPKILKCLHTFCKSCLDGWLRQHRTGALSCPTCRTETECPNNDIDSLPSNLFYKQMVEIVEAYTGQEESSCCRNCDEQKLLRFYCSSCNCLLCEECAALHKKWKDFRGHQLKEIGQLDSSDVEDYSRKTNVCKEHDDKFRFFCEACQICICRDCAILGHVDHKKISLEKGLENKTTEIENKMREVQANGSLLRNKKESLEKRRIKVMSSFERATNSVRTVAEQWIIFIRKHEADIIGKLMKQRDAFEAEFSNQMSSLDGRVVEIESSLSFGEEILSRRNLPEILNVEEMLENRLQELSVPFESTLVFPEFVYSSNNFSCLKDGPGKLIRTVTEPTVSVAEGRGLNEAIEGEESTFTVITKDTKGQIVYSEIDQVNVEIISINTMGILTASMTDSKNGRYQVKYSSQTTDDFKISVTVRGEAIKDSPFRLRVKKRETQTHHQFHRDEMTSRKTGMKAKPKKSKMTDQSGSPIPVQCIIEVTGLPDDVSEDLVTIYFENARRSKGGPVSSVVMTPELRKCLVTFESPDHAERTINHPSHVLSGARLQVSPFVKEDGSAIEFGENKDEDYDEEDGITINVSDIPSFTSKDVLILYFENSRRSGGGDVSEIHYNDKGEAVITFSEVKDLQRLLEEPHKVDDQIITVIRQPPPKKVPLDPLRLHVQGISKMTKDCLSFYLEKFADVEVQEVYLGVKDNALVVFESEPDFESLLHKVNNDKKGLWGKNPRLKRVPVCSCILVTGLKRESTDDTIEFFFDNEKLSGGRDVSGVERIRKDQALVHFEDHTSVQDVIARSQRQAHKIDGVELEVTPYYSFLENATSKGMEVTFDPDIYKYS